jgi:hypothetical protein
MDFPVVMKRTLATVRMLLKEGPSTVSQLYLWSKLPPPILGPPQLALSTSDPVHHHHHRSSYGPEPLELHAPLSVVVGGVDDSSPIPHASPPPPPPRVHPRTHSSPFIPYNGSLARAPSLSVGSSNESLPKPSGVHATASPNEATNGNTDDHHPQQQQQQHETRSREDKRSTPQQTSTTTTKRNDDITAGLSKSEKKQWEAYLRKAGKVERKKFSPRPPSGPPPTQPKYGFFPIALVGGC